MAPKVSPIPPRFRTITPHLVMRDASQAIEFYKKAFGAQEHFRMPGPGGQGVMHAELQIGDSVFMLADEWPNMYLRAPQTIGGTTVSIALYVEDADAFFNKAIGAGAKVVMPLADMFWGDRYGKLTDPFGHEWAICTHKEDVAPDELARRAEAAFAEFAK